MLLLCYASVAVAFSARANSFFGFLIFSRTLNRFRKTAIQSSSSRFATIANRNLARDEVYSGSMSLEINSFRLCRSLISRLNWKAGSSYRVSGSINSIKPGEKIAVFNLKNAVQI